MSRRAAALLALAVAHRALADAAEAEALALDAEPVAVERALADAPALVDRREAARSLGVSLATLDRFCAEGAPFETVGARRRFDLAQLRTWLASRGRRPAKVTKRDEDSIDVSSIARAAGLAGR